MKLAGSGRGWLAIAGFALACGSASVRAQATAVPTPQSSQDTWKQKPEGRAAAAGNQMDCSGSVSSGPDGAVTTTTTCPTGTTTETTPRGTALPGIAQPPVTPASVPAVTSKSPSQQFPYPGSDTNAAPQSPGAATPAANGASDSSVPAGKRFPFPGEAGSSDAGSSSSANSPGGLQDAGSSGNSGSGDSSSSSSSSSSADRDPTAGPLGDDSDDAIAKEAAERRARKRLPKPTPKQTDSDRADEDVRVAGFYQNDGNFRAAYARGLDAVSLAGDDAGAHLALAEAARKLGKLDEAMTHYKRCLALDPLPKQRKAAETALKQMSGGA